MTQSKFHAIDSEKVGRYISVKKRSQLCSKCTLQQDTQQSFMIPEKLFFSAVFQFVQAAIKTIHQHLQG